MSDFARFESQETTLGQSEALRKTAERLAADLPPGPVVLLARTDAAMMCCAAASMLRQWPTEVRRAYIGRASWVAPAGAVLVEPATPGSGLLATLRTQMPAVKLVVLDQAGEAARVAA